MRSWKTFLLLAAAACLAACAGGDPVIPAAVTLQAAAGSRTEALLSWESAGGGITGFRVERSASGGAYGSVAEVGAAASSYADAGLAPATAYSYRVWAVGVGGDLACSGAVEVTTLGTISLTARAVSTRGIVLDWQYTGGASGFRIDRRTGDSAYAGVAEAAAGAASWSDAGLAADTAYTYRIRAFGADGDVACSDDVSAFTWKRFLIDHACASLAPIPEKWILRAKEDLHIAYGHTSHGSQLTTGMTELARWKGGLYAYGSGGADGALDLRDAPFAGASDLGNPDRTAWAAATRAYLGAHADINVILWSWCGQVSLSTEADIENYLTLMDTLKQEYPTVRFVHMTGHLDGSGVDGNLHLRNGQIRRHCLDNDGILYDFADIESFDPDGNGYLALGADDGCNYDSDGNGSRESNWAASWQASHMEGVDWYVCSSAHSEALNANRKAYAAWWLWARLAGWDGR